MLSKLEIVANKETSSLPIFVAIVWVIKVAVVFPSYGLLLAVIDGVRIFVLIVPVATVTGFMV